MKPKQAQHAARISIALAGSVAVQAEMIRLPVRFVFDRDPLLSGWIQKKAYVGDKGEIVGRWEPAGGREGRGCLFLEKGVWQSPAIAVRPDQFVRIRFLARGSAVGHVAVQFFTPSGEESRGGDDYNVTDISSEWNVFEFFCQARQDADTLRVAFSVGNGTLRIDELTVEPIDSAEVLAWNDRLYASLPPLVFQPSTGRWEHLQRTQERLRNGKELTVLLLGDSIANDMGNGQPHLLVERLYPGSRVRLVRSVRGATGCWYYQHHVTDWIAPYQPDLVIVAGISHRGDWKAIRHLVDETRQAVGSTVEFLVLTGAMADPGRVYPSRKDPPEEVTPEMRRAGLAWEAAFLEKVAQMEGELNIATFDIRTAWEQYLEQSGKPREWFLRDEIHANHRGKQILARLLANFFDPSP